MKGKELVQYRVSLFEDAVRTGRTPKRVPVYDNVYNWKVYSAGYKLSEALNNPSVMHKVVEEYCKVYQPDALADAGARNPLYFTSIFSDSQFYEIDDEGYRMNYRDNAFMTADDYDALIKDPKAFIWSTLLPRKWKNLQSKNNGKYYAKGVDAFLTFGQAAGKAAKAMEKYGIPQAANVMDMIPFQSGFEYIFDGMRGIKGISMDMRRNKEKLLEACHAIEAFFRSSAPLNTTPGHNSNCAFDLFLPMLAHTILSEKQFELYMWPKLKELGDYLVQYDKTCLLFVEGHSERFYDFFNQLPNGHFAIYTEENDIFEMKKALNGKCIVGGMPVSLLGNGTPGECVDYAKKLVQELGYDGNYIFSQDKMISFPNDARKENMIAVSKYLQEGQY